MNQLESVNQLLRLLKHSASPFHSMAEAIRQLESAGFTRWELTGGEALTPGKAYYVSVYDRTLMAFYVPAGAFCGFRIATGHIDNPCFIIKPHPERSKSGYVTLNVERYGGPILNTWMDRPLTIAGKVWLASDDLLHPQSRLYSSEKPVAVIPNLAIHMNREVNRGIELKVQTDLEPVVSLLSGEQCGEGLLAARIADELAVRKEDILNYELFLCNADEPVITGFDGEFLSAPRLDNLTSCQSCLNGIIEAGCPQEYCNISVLFDHEECGSRSKQGAASTMLVTLMEKIYLMTPGTSKKRSDFLDTLLNSMTVSLDVAHATHPNHPEKNDPTNRIPLDGGVIFKLNYNQNYATDTHVVSVLENLCRQENIPHAKFINQGDTAGGGTLGSILSATVPVMTADVGVPILSMHSCRELMAVSSQLAMDHFVAAFFRK